MNQLNEIDTTDISPLYNVLDTIDITRQDIENNTLSKKDFLFNTNDKDEDYVILPRIV